MIGVGRFASLRGRVCSGVVARNYAALIRSPFVGREPSTKPLVASLANSFHFEFDKRKRKPPTPDDGRTIEEVVASIDTTLTPEQQAYVDKLKKKMKGAGKKRSPYRDVPFPSEIDTSEPVLPNMAPNAESLIDWALSHVPKRDGPRRSRFKKRMLQRTMQKNAMAATLKANRIKNKLANDQKRKRIRKEVEEIRKTAEAINATRKMKNEVVEAKIAKVKAQLEMLH